MIILFRTKKDKQRIAGILILGIPLIWIFLVVGSPIIRNVTQAVGRDSSFTNRTLFWPTLIAEAKSHPLLGAGFGGYFGTPGNWLLETYGYVSGHNGLLDSVVELGAIGVILSFSPDSTAAGQAVQFTDTSKRSPTSWRWDFGDGSSGNVQNLMHIFNDPGSYSVSLVVSNEYESSSISTNVVVKSGDGSDRTYWVSPIGEATWANARSDTPLSGSACCSLATANAHIAAGDTASLRGGTYTTGINPLNSGSSISSRIIYQAYPGETPTISSTNVNGIQLIGSKSYIKVDGIKIYLCGSFFRIHDNSCYNEITNCYFESNQSIGGYAYGDITCEKSDYSFGGGSNHNWFHGNIFTKYGYIASCAVRGSVRIGAGGSSGQLDPSCNNTFENNNFSYGGHDLIDIGGRFNVARNNFFHNEEAYYTSDGTCPGKPVGGYYGDRCIILTNYGDGIGTAQHNLVEGNRCSHPGQPPDADGGNCIEDAGYHTVIRFNNCYGANSAAIENKKQGGYTNSVRSGSKQRIYNNTLYYNGFGDGYVWGLERCGIYIGAVWTVGEYDWPQDVAIKNNIIYDSYNNQSIKFETPYVEAAGPVVCTNNLTTDPSFTNASLADKTSLTLPNLNLRVGSPAIDGGTHLTVTDGSGSNSTSLIVDDAYYFQDGTWGSSLSDMHADWIAIGTVSNVVQIKSVDYKNGVITLVSPMTWSSKAPIWLFSNSRGQRVLSGTAPNVGAH